MTTLQHLHEQFIEQANRPMTFGSLPIRPQTPEAPVIPVDRWRESAGALYKTYRFRRGTDRTDFVVQLLAYEASVGHNAQIRIDEELVDLKLTTRDVGRVTELDKEYAHYADVLFRDLVYSSHHGDEG